MPMYKYRYILSLLLSLLTLTATAQSQLYNRYIERYSSMAVDQMQRYGIPASITLAQGLLESSAGTSRLATKANNHFGIKVGVGWKGKYIVAADDRPDDRFRVYSSVAESYEDHSLFLKNGRRYAFLFNLDRKDYRSWAKGLKKAGYATSPTYATSLIELIEKYRLYEYDDKKHKHQSREEKEAEHLQEKAGTHRILRCNGQYYLIARAGDTYASIAKQMKVREKKLRRYNDAEPAQQLREGDAVFLGTKAKKADRALNRKYHILAEGESLYTISQRYGIRLSSLCKMNPIKSDYHFRVGDKVRIR